MLNRLCRVISYLGVWSIVCSAATAQLIDETFGNSSPQHVCSCMQGGRERGIDTSSGIFSGARSSSSSGRGSTGSSGGTGGSPYDELISAAGQIFVSGSSSAITGSGSGGSQSSATGASSGASGLSGGVGSGSDGAQTGSSGATGGNDSLPTPEILVGPDGSSTSTTAGHVGGDPLNFKLQGEAGVKTANSKY